MLNSQKISNDPNPILVQYRNLIEEGSDWESLAWVITHNSVGGNLVRFAGCDTPHISHAKKVLTRLVNIFGTEESR